MKDIDLYEFSWGRFASALGILGLIAILFDFESIILMGKMFLYTVFVPVIGIFAFSFCCYAPTRALFWSVVGGLMEKMEEMGESLYQKAERSAWWILLQSSYSQVLYA